MSSEVDRRSLPVALTIAGSDSSAGAGIQADLKTFSALGVYGLTAVTCVVAETPGKVARIQDISTDVVREQIDVLLNGFPGRCDQDRNALFERNHFSWSRKHWRRARKKFRLWSILSWSRPAAMCF